MTIGDRQEPQFGVSNKSQLACLHHSNRHKRMYSLSNSKECKYVYIGGLEQRIISRTQSGAETHGNYWPCPQCSCATTRRPLYQSILDPPETKPPYSPLETSTVALGCGGKPWWPLHTDAPWRTLLASAAPWSVWFLSYSRSHKVDRRGFRSRGSDSTQGAKYPVVAKWQNAHE